MVGTLATPMRPLASSTRATSVNVPPISTPIRQAIAVLPVRWRSYCRLERFEIWSGSLVGRQYSSPQVCHRRTTAIMTHILHRQIGHAYPVAASAQGVVIRDSAGKEYIDASGGAAVSCLGHSHPDVLAAMHAQLDRLAYAHTSFFTTQAAEELADDLSRTRRRASAMSSTSAAARRRSKPRSSSHANISSNAASRNGDMSSRAARAITAITLGALAVGGREWQRKQFAPLLIETHHVSPVYEYRDRRADETPQAYGERLAAGARGQDRRARRRQRHRFRRRDGGRRHPRRGPGGARLFQARARHLRPPRHSADSRRGDVRHGPHRHAARLRAGGHQPRPDGDRQGARRRLCADRRRS